MPHTPRHRRLTWPLGGVLIGLLTLLMAGRTPGDADSTTSKAPPPAASALELQLEMAASDSFYLEIDPTQNIMRLRLAGVALRDYPLLAIEQGTPRLAFVPLGQPLHVAGTTWMAGELDPPRPEVRVEIMPPDPNAPDSTLPVFKPPPAIEEMPVPPTFRIRYAGGLTLTVTSPRPAAAGLRGWSEAVRDKLGALREALSTRQGHLRVVLDRADAQHLFRSMPPRTCLVVLPS